MLTRTVVFTFCVFVAVLCGCDARSLDYQSCYPNSEQPDIDPSPLFACFVEWCVEGCDTDQPERERIEEKLLAPSLDRAEDCWVKLTDSDQYVDLERGCVYAGTFSKEEGAK